MLSHFRPHLLSPPFVSWECIEVEVGVGVVVVGWSGWPAEPLYPHHGRCQGVLRPCKERKQW